MTNKLFGGGTADDGRIQCTEKLLWGRVATMRLGSCNYLQVN
jgi:hypothetical protein